MRPADVHAAGPEATDDRFAQLLAGVHESVALGIPSRGDTSRDASRGDTPAELAERLAGAGECLRLIERIRRVAPGARAVIFDPDAAPSGRARPDGLSDVDAFATSRSADETVRDEWPRTIGRFELIRPLGQGGCGIVFLARDPRLRRDVALKVPRPEIVLTGDLKRRFHREAETAASLSHAGIVPVFESGQDGAVCYIASAFCEGPSLKEWLAGHRGAVAVEDAARLVSQLAQAVQHAHDRGVLHRDLKPANILLEPSGAGQGSGHVPKITDFGLAKLLDGAADETRSGAIIGTPAYMAPEQADARNAEIGPATDVYALGVILYELLTGVSPFARETPFLTVQAVRQAEPARLRRHRPSVPRDLEAICLRCLEKQPRARYARATDLSDDLERFLRSEPVHARPVRSVERLVRWSRRNPVLAGVSALAALLLVSVSVVSTLAALRIEQQRAALEKSLGRTADAERTSSRSERLARRRVYETLVAQATSERTSGRAGQRIRSLAALAEAADLARELDLPAETFRDLRNAAVASLALADLESDRRWPVPFNSGLGSGVAFDPDVERYAVPDARGIAATIYRFEDNQPVRRVVAPDAIGSHAVLAFGPVGRYLAAQGTDGRRTQITVWDVASGRNVLTTDARFLLPQTYLQFAFSSDERLLAVAHADHSIGIFSLESGARLQQLPSAGAVSALAFAPGGNTLAVSRSRRVQIIDLEAEQLLSSLDGQPNKLAWDSTGDRLAMAGPLDTVEIWKPALNERLLTLTEPHGKLAEVVFSPDGALLATSTHNGIIRIWDAATGHELISTTGRACRFSRDGRWLALQCRGPEVERMRVFAGREYLRLDGSRSMETLLFVDPLGSWAITLAGTATHFWDLNHARLAKSLANETAGAIVAVARGSSVLEAWRRVPGGGLIRHPLVIREEQDATVLELHPASSARITGEHPAAVERVLALRSGDVALDRATGRPVVLLNGRHTGDVIPVSALRNLAAVALDPQGRWLAAVDDTDSMIVVDRASGQRVWEYDLEHTYAVGGFSPDGTLLAVGTARAARFFEAGTWRPKAHFERPPEVHNLETVNVAWNSDGSLIACQEHDHVLRLLDRTLTTELLRLEIGPDECIHSLAFSDDGSRLVAGTREGRLHVWNLWWIRYGLRRIGLDWSGERWPALPADPPEHKPLVVRFLDPELDATDPAQVAPTPTAVPLRRRLVRSGDPIAARDRAGSESGAPDSQPLQLRDRVATRPPAAQTALEKQVDACAQQIRAKPDDAGGYWRRARALLGLSRSEEALVDASRATELAPESHHGWFWRARALQNLSRCAEAIESFERSRAILPDDSWCCLHLASLYTEGPAEVRDPRRGLLLAERALELARAGSSSNASRAVPLFLNVLAAARYRNGDSRQALAALDEAAKISGDPPAASMLLRRALCHHQLGQIDQARQAYEQALAEPRHEPHEAPFNLETLRQEAAEAFGAP